MTFLENRKVDFSFIDWFLPIFMILAQYRVGGTFSNYGFVILIIYALYYTIFTNRIIMIPKQLLVFTVYITIISFVNVTVMEEGFSVVFFNRTLMPLILIYTLSTVIPNINENNLFKAYVLIGSIAMGIMYYQAILLFLAGIPAVPVTILPVPIDQEHFWGNFSGTRPSSLFQEPQAYASFMLPLLVLSLKRKNTIFSLIISLSILLSTSSLGIIMVGLVYLYFAIIGGIRTYMVIFRVFIVSILVFVFIKLEIFVFARDKILLIEFEDNIRLTRGF